MRFSHAVILASLAALVPAGPAAAQGYSGQDVLVNPPAGASETLLYPGGQYRRTVSPLLQPGERPSDMGQIQLHMPSRKPVRVALAPALAPTPARPVEEAPPPPRPKPVRPAPKPAPKVARAEPPPRSVTAPPAAGTPGLTKQSVIIFSANATDPAQSALGAIKFLAGNLSDAMTGPGSRIELKAYGGQRGDKSSDAHRLALKRALSIRQVLIDDGVSADRIDVQAAGGVDDDGPADRVDVYIKA